MGISFHAYHHHILHPTATHSHTIPFGPTHFAMHRLAKYLRAVNPIGGFQFDSATIVIIFYILVKLVGNTTRIWGTAQKCFASGAYHIVRLWWNRINVAFYVAHWIKTPFVKTSKKRGGSIYSRLKYVQTGTVETYNMLRCLAASAKKRKLLMVWGCWGRLGSGFWGTVGVFE